MIQNLLSAADLDVTQIKMLLNVAKALAPRVHLGENIPLLQGKTVVNLFFENSTRTRTSFELATRKLAGGTLNFAASTSSA